jgi:hypothetical protein
MYYIWLSVLLLALLAVLIVIRKRSNIKEKHTQNASTVSIPTSPVLDIKKTAEATEEEFYSQFKTLVLLYYKSQLSMETIVKCYQYRKAHLITQMQNAALDVAGTNARLISRLESLQAFLEKSYGQILELRGILSRRKRKKFNAKVKVVRRFLGTLQENGGARVAHVFYMIPTKDDEMFSEQLEKPFEECYCAVFSESNVELQHILRCIQFDFDKFENLMTLVACAQMEYVEALRKRSESKEICNRFIKFREEDIELLAIIPEDV